MIYEFEGQEFQDLRALCEEIMAVEDEISLIQYSSHELLLPIFSPILLFISLQNEAYLASLIILIGNLILVPFFRKIYSAIRKKSSLLKASTTLNAQLNDRYKITYNQNKRIFKSLENGRRLHLDTGNLVPYYE